MLIGPGSPSCACVVPISAIRLRPNVCGANHANPTIIATIAATTTAT